MEYLFTEDQYQEAVMSLADTLCGTSCGMAADAIIEYCSRPDMSKRQLERLYEGLGKFLE